MWAVVAALMKTSELGVTEKVGGGSRRSLLGTPRGASMKTLSLLSGQRLRASHCEVRDLQNC